MEGEKSVLSPTKSSSGKRDFLFIAFFIFLIQGIGSLFPWNAFISAPDYFVNVEPNTVIYMSVSYTIPNLVGMIVMVFYGSQISLLLQILTPYITQIGILLLVPVLLLTNVIAQRIGIYLLLILCIVTGYTSAVVIGGISGFASMMPSQYMTAVMTGQGLAGIGAALLRMLTKGAIERSPAAEHDKLVEEQKISVTIFFFVAAGVILVCIITYLILLQLPYVKNVLRRTQNDEDDEEEENDILSDDLKKSDLDYQEVAPIEDAMMDYTPKASPFKIFRKIGIYAVSIWINYVITLAIFPGIISKITSQADENDWWHGWFLNFLVLVFNIFDLVGRAIPILTGKISFRLPGFSQARSIDQYLFPFTPIFILCRIILLPIFILSSLNLPWFHFDAIPFVFMVIMGLSNGYLTSNVMSYSPSKLEGHEQMIGGIIMGTALVCGVASGSLVALMSDLIRGFF